MKPITKAAFDAACREVDAVMKRTNGHQFMHALKTRCMWCNRSPNAKGRCSAWFNTFLFQLSGFLTGVYGAPTNVETNKKSLRVKG